MMSKVIKVVKDEIVAIIPAFVYFFITFNIIGYTKVLLLRGYGIHVSTFINASIGAILAAKAILIVDLLPFAEIFPETPIFYNVAWKTLIYWTAAFVIQLLEEGLPLLMRHEDLAIIWAKLEEPSFWVIQIWLAMVLFVFCAFNELIHVLGAKAARRILLGGRASGNTA